MTHISEEDLILLHYDDSADEGARQHLDFCLECRRDADVLEALLTAVDREPIPEPAADYENRIWSSIRWKLTPPRSSSAPTRWIPAAVAASALLVAGYLAGRFAQDAAVPAASPVTRQVASAISPSMESSSQERLFTAAAVVHFDRSGRLLMELANETSAPGSARVTQQEAAQSLVASNRLVRVLANQAGHEQIARLLNEIEPILLEVVHASGESSADLEAVRARIDTRALLFKLRVIRSTLDQRDHAAVAAPSRQTTDL